jgi:hypothetical protein
MFRYLQSPLCLEIEMDFRDNGVGMYALKLDDATVPKNTWVMYNSDRRIYFLTLLRNVLKVHMDIAGPCKGSTNTATLSWTTAIPS